jgi:signal transduction histidine kinase
MEVRPPQRRWLPRLPQQTADGLLGVLVTAWQLGLLLVVRAYEGGRLQYAKPGGVAVLLVAAQGLPLVWRRRRPLLVLVVVLVANTAYYALGLPLTGFDFALPVALYSAAAYTSQRTSLLAAAATVASFVTLYGLAVGPFWSSVPFSTLAWLVAIFAGVWVWGRYLQIRRAYTAELEARAERAERDREAEARRAVAAERARIARELHDVVAHHVSMMVVQAEAGPVAVEHDPARAAGAFEAIAATGRQALVEMRRLLGMLRGEEEQAPSLAPQPGLAEVPSLVEQVGRAGLRVELVVEGPKAALPPGIDLSAYRIVQEALTNAVRHGGGGQARVLVRYGEHDLELQIENDLVPPSAAADPFRPADSPVGDRQIRRSGRGLLGMRERVNLFGGELRAGSGPNGGFTVVARLPIGDPGS